VIVVHEAGTPIELVDRGISRQALLTDQNVSGTRVLIERIKLDAGDTYRFGLSSKSLAWMQVLKGGATFKSYYKDRMSEGYSALLPPGFDAELITDTGTTLLHVDIPNVGSIDPDFASRTALFFVSDWTRELVYASTNDARKRLPLVTPKLSDTQAIKVEMVVFPPGSAAPECHHEGADTYMYVLTGRGTARGGGQSQTVSPGDLIYFPDRERHTLAATGTDEMLFLEFHAPAEFKTVWTDPSKKSAWVATGLDFRNRRTEGEDRERFAFSRTFSWTR
jgi:quercetin dioxygenase-like cupin family protein